MDDNLCEFFKESEFGESNINAGGDDLFAFLESLDGLPEFPPFTPLEETGSASYPNDAGQETTTLPLVTQKSISSSSQHDSSDAEAEPEPETSPKSKKPKLASSEETNPDGQQKMSHITVERNRRKQMNEHISLLRSLMPCFYVKRGDQASIIGGVVDYINELQQVLQSLEAKKQRKFTSEVLSPRIVSSPRPSPLSPRKPPLSPRPSPFSPRKPPLSPRPSPLSPRKPPLSPRPSPLSPRKPPLSPRPSPISPRIPPLSPRLNLPISPRTPQSGSPYKPRLHQGYLSPTASAPTTSSTSSADNINELVANSRSPVAQVEVKFSGPNLMIKTVSPRIPGQTMKIISTLEDLSLEILNININTVDDIMLNSFTIKIGIECQLSAEELAHQIQQTFS